MAPEKDMSVSQQRELAGASRATVYAQGKPQFVCVVELLCRLIDEESTRRPFYGSRERVCYLLIQGHVLNRRRVQRLMRAMRLAGMAPGPNTSKTHPEHKIHPALSHRAAIVRPHQVWRTDITYSTPDARLRLSGRRDRLVQPQGARLAHQQQYGRVVLRRLP